MKILILIAGIAALELYFGINDTGGKVALALLIWSLLAVGIEPAFGEFCRRGWGGDDDGPWTGV